MKDGGGLGGGGDSSLTTAGGGDSPLTTASRYFSLGWRTFLNFSYV